MDSITAALEREYCPPLDPALFSAIILDFDLTDASALRAARETLDAIKTSALDTDSSTFDPSGNSARSQDPVAGNSLEFIESSSEAAASRSEETDVSSLSSGLRGVSIGQNHARADADSDYGYIDQVQRLDEPAKILLLKEMFPESSEFTVSYTLKKSGGDWSRALEELLNHTFFNADAPEGEYKVVTKGVEVFSEEQVVRGGRKQRNKKQKRALGAVEDRRSSSLPPIPDTQHSSSWEKGRVNVDFISSRVNVSAKTVASLYHQHGASVPATITALIESPLGLSEPEQISTSGPSIIAAAIDLCKDFPSLSDAQSKSLIRLTYPSTVAAHELAKALTASGMTGRGGIEVIPRYAPFEATLDQREWTPAAAMSKSGSSTPTTSADAAQLATSLLEAQQRSFAQASAAYRRGKSDHHMSGAAAYYSQQGRDYAVRRAEATSEAADVLVESQSTPDTVDLHGVSVKDAVRIAKEKTDEWWRSKRKIMGMDGRVTANNGQETKLVIVTGVGRHSTGGKAKIGPPVGRMLVQEGWQVIVGEGVFTVVGKKI